MGYYRSHAIVIEGHYELDKDEIGILIKTHKKARELFGSRVSGILGDFVNGSCSFFIAPDGSKEGWEASEESNKHRDDFINWIKTQNDYIAWVEVQFNDDANESKVTRHSDE